MVTVHGFYRAIIEVFGIISIYASAVVSLTTATSFVFGFIVQTIIFLVAYLYFQSMNWIPSTDSIILSIYTLSTQWIVINLAGLIGTIYFFTHLRQFKKLFDKSYIPSEKEMQQAIIYAVLNSVLLVIYIWYFLLK